MKRGSTLAGVALVIVGLCALALGACGDETPSGSVDAGGTGGADAGGVGGADEAPPDTGADEAGDPDPGGDPGTIDSGPDAPEADVAPPLGVCPEGGPVALEPDPVDPAQKKFALSMFHYNVQYVIGGLEYTDDEGVTHYMVDQPEAHGWDNDRVEDWIITETYVPILEMYARHPSWKVTLEMQAYMVSVMAERHPEALALTRELANRGQAELVSFHHDDQLFLAFPREDLQRSMDRTKAIFAEHCLPLSGAVFNQEGQAGEGRQQMLVDNGYTIGVFPKNLFRYVREGEAWWPYYESRGGTLVVGPGGVDAESGVEVTWTFFDDGELRSVPKDVNPYLAPFFVQDAERVAEYEATLEALEADGWKITTLTDYVAQLEGQGIEKKAAPPLLDGTWQPPSTDSIHRWLGGRSQAFSGADEDNWVRSGNALARLHVAAIDVLYAHAAEQGVAPEGWEARLAELWQIVWRSQVSDCSGVNPWRGEVLHCTWDNQWLLDETSKDRQTLKAALDYPFVLIDTKARSVTKLDDLPMPEPPAPVEPQLELQLEALGRDVSDAWFESGPGDSRWEVHVNIGPATVDPDCDACELYRRVTVGFPRTEDVIRYSPGLIEDEVVSYPFGDFSFLEGEVYLPLANGLIGLGEGWWAVKHTRTVHIAVRLRPDTPYAQFIDATMGEADAQTWVFEVFQADDEAEALEIANRINIYPVVMY